MSKFTKIADLKGWKILSDEKYVKAKKIAQTEKYKILYLKTDKNSLKCADNHIVFDENYKEIFAKDLREGMRIVGKDGLETVLSVIETNEYENMYDVEVDDDCHRYFTNGILSHNTTTVTCFLLHYILFNFDKKVAVLANKGSMAREILSRIQLGYINLPKWIQSGIKSWNKGSIELENGCSIIAAATSSDSVRGSSFSCVTGDTPLYVKTEHGYTSIKTFDELKELPQEILSQYTVFTNQGYKHFDGIRVTYDVPNLICLHLTDNRTLKCTYDHKLLTYEGEWKEAKDIKVGDSFAGFGLRVESIDYINDNVYPVYDLINVEDTQSYYTEKVISHNCIFIDECIGGDSMITVRNKKTGVIEKISMADFYDKLN